MKKFRIITAVIMVVALFVVCSFTNKKEDCEASIKATQKEAVSDCETTYKPKLSARYTSLGVPNINSSFKTWMSYKAVTNINSNQYKFIQ